MLRLALTQAAEIDNLADPRISCCLREVQCSLEVELFEIAISAPTHRVDQVVGDVYAFQRRSQSGRIQHVPPDDLAAGLRQRNGGIGPAGHTAWRHASLGQPPGQLSTDVTGSSCD